MIRTASTDTLRIIGLTNSNEAVLAHEQLGRNLKRYIPATGGVAYLFSPFINTQTLLHVLGHRTGEPTVIVTSWRLDHLVFGASSLDCYDACKENGWTLYINDALHAKFYSTSLRSAWLGSANLTNKGLSYTDHPNIELLYYVPVLPTEVRIWAHRVIAKSRLVTDELYSWYKEVLKAQPEPPIIDHTAADRGNTTTAPFLISQLPASTSPHRLWMVSNDPSLASEDWNEMAAVEHDRALYGANPFVPYEDFLHELDGSFFAHPFVDAIVAQITSEGVRFGEIKEWIQNNCTDVPVPYRRELTPHVQSLYQWLITLSPDRFEIIQPHITQIIRTR